MYINNNLLKRGDFPGNMGILIDTLGLLLDYSATKNLELLASVNNKINNKDIEDVLNLVGLDPENKKS